MLGGAYDNNNGHCDEYDYLGLLWWYENNKWEEK